MKVIYTTSNDPRLTAQFPTFLSPAVFTDERLEHTITTGGQSFLYQVRTTMYLELRGTKKYGSMNQDIEWKYAFCNQFWKEKLWNYLQGKAVTEGNFNKVVHHSPLCALFIIQLYKNLFSLHNLHSNPRQIGRDFVNYTTWTSICTQIDSQVQFSKSI